MKQIRLGYTSLFSALLVLYSGSVFAISPEAKDAIEKIRLKLVPVTVKQEAKEEVKKESKGYVPGEDLARALKRLRMTIRHTGSEELSVNIKKYEKSVSLGPVDQYVPGEALKNSLRKFQALRDNKDVAGFIKPELKIESQKINAVEVMSRNEPAAEPEVLAPASVPERIEETHKLVEVKKAQNRKTTNAKHTEQDFRDKEFNADIRKFEFKMPKNYRIIVR